MAEISRESLASTHPKELQKVEDFLASSPDGRADPNNRGVNKAAIQLALAAVEQGHEPPKWLNPMFRRMLGYPPEIDRHTSLKGQRTLNQLTTILKGIPLERRESLLMQETHGVRVLCWSLAHLSGTLTPAIAERAAWKVADLGERENGGGTWTDPHLRDHQRMLFPHLGAIAVPALVQEIDAGARRRHLLMDALGETRCPEAAEPLVQYVASGAEKLRNLAKVGLNRLLEEGHLTAIYDAVEKQLKAKKKALRVAAAEVLVMLPNNEETTTIVTHALNTAKDAEVRFRLQCWQGAQQDNPDEQFCRECQAAADPDKMAYVDSFLDTQNDNVTKYDVIPTMATWSQADQVAGCVKLAVGDVEHYYTVTELIEKDTLKDSERSIRAIAWGAMDYIDHFRYDFQVTSLLECLESWNKEPTLDPILHVLQKSPGSRVTIYEYLTKRGFFLSNPLVLEALAQGLADSSKAVQKICKEALGKAGSAARPILEELQEQAPKAARKSMDELLASLPTEQPHTRIAHIDREALAAAHPPAPATHLEGTVPRFFPSSKYSVHLHHFRPEQTDVPSEAIVSIDHPSQEQLETALAQPGLQSLNLYQANYYDKLPESAFGLLANSPSIRWLAASVYAYSDKDNPWLNNKSLAKLEGMDALEVLILRQHAGLTSLEHLPLLPSLRVLSTHGSTIKVDAKSLRALKQQPQLVSLLLDAASEPSGSYYKNSRTNDKVLASLAELTNLKQLSLIHCEKLKGPGFEAFADHPQLGWLDLTSCHKLQNAETMAHISNIPHLRILDLETLLGTDHAMLEPLTNCPSLTALQVDTLHLDDAALDTIAQIKTLQTLSLRCDSLWKEPGSRFPVFSDDAYRTLHTLPHLETLIIEDTMWNRNRLEHILSLPIKHLWLQPRRQFSKEDYLLLAEMKELRSLCLGSDPLDIATELQEAMPHCAVTTFCFHDEPQKGFPDDDGLPISMS